MVCIPVPVLQIWWVAWMEKWGVWKETNRAWGCLSMVSNCRGSGHTGVWGEVWGSADTSKPSDWGIKPVFLNLSLLRVHTVSQVFFAHPRKMEYHVHFPTLPPTLRPTKSVLFYSLGANSLSPSGLPWWAYKPPRLGGLQITKYYLSFMILEARKFKVKMLAD